MFWFNGNINEAINKSKIEKKVFVVYINGEDDISNKMDDIYEKLSSKLSELPLVAIKLDSKSDNCKLFSQIYPVILIPSTYFIDYNGVAIEIIGGSVDDQNVLMEKINKTIETYYKSLPINESENTNQTSNNESLNISSDSVNDATTSSVTELVVNEGTSQSADVSEETMETNIEDKVKRANQLIEALRLKKAKEEEEKQRIDEIERRKGMKEMQKSKRLREDKEALEAIQEREREKNAEKMARQRVLAQIAADKEERRKRQMEFSNQQMTEHNNSNESNDQQTEVRQRAVHDKTRIQFRLPDGSTSNHIFEANDKLENVRQYVSTNFNIRSFVLSTTFPRKEFATEEYSNTLQELNLCPSAVLLVLIKSATNKSGALVSPSFFSQIITYITFPFLMIWNLLTGFFGGNRLDNNSDNRNEKNSQNRPQTSNRNTFSNREGNIHRMRNDENDDDDDNNTWNGNSTQQM